MLFPCSFLFLDPLRYFLVSLQIPACNIPQVTTTTIYFKIQCIVIHSYAYVPISRILASKYKINTDGLLIRLPAKHEMEGSTHRTYMMGGGKEGKLKKGKVEMGSGNTHISKLTGVKIIHCKVKLVIMAKMAHSLNVFSHSLPFSTLT